MPGLDYEDHPSSVRNVRLFGLQEKRRRVGKKIGAG